MHDNRIHWGISYKGKHIAIRVKSFIYPELEFKEVYVAEVHGYPYTGLDRKNMMGIKDRLVEQMANIHKEREEQRMAKQGQTLYEHCIQFPREVCTDDKGNELVCGIDCPKFKINKDFVDELLENLLGYFQTRGIAFEEEGKARIKLALASAYAMGRIVED